MCYSTKYPYTTSYMHLTRAHCSKPLIHDYNLLVMSTNLSQRTPPLGGVHYVPCVTLRRAMRRRCYAHRQERRYVGTRINKSFHVHSLNIAVMPRSPCHNFHRLFINHIITHQVIGMEKEPNQYRASSSSEDLRTIEDALNLADMHTSDGLS